MKVLRRKYIIEGKTYDSIPDLESFKEGVIVESVLAVEECTEEDKSGVKTAQKGDEKGDEKGEGK